MTVNDTDRFMWLKWRGCIHRHVLIKRKKNNITITNWLALTRRISTHTSMNKTPKVLLILIIWYFLRLFYFTSDCIFFNSTDVGNVFFYPFRDLLPSNRRIVFGYCYRITQTNFNSFNILTWFFLLNHSALSDWHVRHLCEPSFQSNLTF